MHVYTFLNQNLITSSIIIFITMIIWVPQLHFIYLAMLGQFLFRNRTVITVMRKHENGQSSHHIVKETYR